MPDDRNAPWRRSASDRDRNHNMGAICGFMLTVLETQRPNDQLTDGGPSVTPELPTGVAGPPFGAAPLLGFLAGNLFIPLFVPEFLVLPRVESMKDGSEFRGKSFSQGESPSLAPSTSSPTTKLTDRRPDDDVMTPPAFK